MNYIIAFLIPVFFLASAFQRTYPDAMDILKKVDRNMVSNNKVTESRMVIYGRRNSRTVSSKSYGEGSRRSFTEYLSPAREKGTKMLKLEKQLWIYSPSTDRTIQLSGHMLRQSVMGSDLSYEDMMEDRKLVDMYHAKVVDEETYRDRKVWVVKLTAKVENVAYHSCTFWIDQRYFVPLKEELFAKSGQLLKRITMSQVQKVGGRWYPKKINYRDVLKSGKGTDFIIDAIEFDAAIPPYLFTKAALRK